MFSLEQTQPSSKGRHAAAPDLQPQPPSDGQMSSNTHTAKNMNEFQEAADQAAGSTAAPQRAVKSRNRRVQQGKQRCRHCHHQQRRSLKDDLETPARTPEDQEPVLIHGLSVERYRAIYNSVLQPPVRAALSSSRNTDYVEQVLEVKQRLWTALGRPLLEEVVMEDGRVEVKEIFDLT